MFVQISGFVWKLCIFVTDMNIDIYSRTLELSKLGNSGTTIPPSLQLYPHCPHLLKQICKCHFASLWDVNHVVSATAECHPTKKRALPLPFSPRFVTVSSSSSSSSFASLQNMGVSQRVIKDSLQKRVLEKGKGDGTKMSKIRGINVLYLLQ